MLEVEGLITINKDAMGKTSKKIEAIIYDSGESPFFSFRFFLSMISKVYGGAVKLRRLIYKKNILKSKRLPCPVISIGNITLGGTGKTPMTIYIVQTLKQWGYNVAVISRGYKGGAEKIGGIVSDGKVVLMTPEISGDEPYLMAKKLNDVPVIVGKNRFKSGRLAISKFNPDVIVLDDGFQHLTLQRDLDIVLLDYNKPFGNRHLLPRGGMREPVSALLCADVIILTKTETVNNMKTSSSMRKLGSFERKHPIYRSFHLPLVSKIINGEKKIPEKNMQEGLRQSIDCVKGRTVFAFSGLADNHNFLRTLKSLNCNVLGFMEFPDHHPYSERDLDNILSAAKRSMSECLITTEKDYVRIVHKIDWPYDLFVIGIEIDFGADKKRFNSYIKNWIKNQNESNYKFSKSTGRDS